VNFPQSKTLAELLAEADELIRKFDAGFLPDLEEGPRRQIEEHARRLEELKETAQQQAGKAGHPEGGSYAEGIHEAVLDIVKAMKDLSRYFS
jgi:hypothetical protein